MRKEDLFNNRIDVGRRLSELIKTRKTTKKDLCDKAHISRPTLDRMLEGKIENKNTFDKQIEKVLQALGITADEFVRCPTPSEGSNIAIYRKQLGYSQSDLAKRIGVSLATMKKWESDSSNISEDEWSDIALALNTDSGSVKGNNFLSAQVPVYDYVLKEGVEGRSLSGYAGYIIILPDNSNEEYSFAVTFREWDNALASLQESSLSVIPCMGNKLLLVNNDNVKKVEFLDDDYDDLDAHRKFFDFVPNEMFNLLDAYIQGDYDDENKLNEKHSSMVEKTINNSGYEHSQIEEMLSSIVVHYSDGQKEVIPVENYSCVASLVLDAYYDESSADKYKGAIFGIHDDTEECNLFINLNRVSFIEMPLMKVEKAMHFEDL